MDGLETLSIEISQRNEQLREANRANKEWKERGDKASEQRKLRDEAFEARI